MKNIKKQNNMVDVMAEARKSKKFQIYSENAGARIKLAVEIYKAREKQGLSQQQLANRINTTQKVISKIENGDVNIGIELLSRIAKNLNFTSNNFTEIFGCPLLARAIFFSQTSNDKFVRKIEFKTNANTINK